MESFLTVSVQERSRASSTRHVISSTSKVLAWLEGNLSSASDLPSREYLDSNRASWVVRGMVLEDRLVRLNSRRRTVVRRDGELDKRRRMVQAMAKHILDSSAERTLDITISSVHSTSASYFVLSHQILTKTPREQRRDVPRHQRQPVSNISVIVEPVVSVSPVVHPVVAPAVPTAVAPVVPPAVAPAVALAVAPAVAPVVAPAVAPVVPPAVPPTVPVVPRDDHSETRETGLNVVARNERAVTDSVVTRVTCAPRPANGHRLRQSKSSSRLQAIRNVFSKLTGSRTSRGTSRTVTTQTSPRLLRMSAQISAVDRKDYFTDVGLKCSRC